ncbi:GAF domain-containing protein [Bacillus sp. Marseille-P3661]|uniref:GAF domain-containing protein n=1 Tax=Bacillus sp. Marseille-P3661 TaxID=1936234 RepID=UPI000C831514|nr:GAF domain-containing protein [Bacillus sp. Marseille-P3661]
MKDKNIVVFMKDFATNKKIKDLLTKINPYLAKKESNLRIHLESLINNGITDEQFMVIDAKMKLGKLCIDLEELIPNSFATILFYVKEENRIYHGAAPNIPLHFFDFFNEINDKQLFHEMVCGRAIASKEIVYSDILSDPQCIHERHFSEERGFQSVLSIPFFKHDSIMGTFALFQTIRKKPNNIQIEQIKQLVLDYEDEIYRLSNNLISTET